MPEKKDKPNRLESLQDQVDRIERRLERHEIRAARESAKPGGALHLLYDKKFKNSKFTRDVLRNIAPTRGNEEIARILDKRASNVRAKTAFLKTEGLIERIKKRPARYRLTADGVEVLRLCERYHGTE